jgi:uncharacterized protein
MRRLIYFSAVIFITACNSSSEKKSIHVTGHANLKVVPDMVELSLRARNIKPAMKDAVAQTQSDVNEILAVCKKYISSASDIKVSTISTNKTYEYRNNREVFTGFEATQVLEVSLKNILAIEKFTEELLATKISRIDNIRYNHTKADSIMREVNLMALDDARKTADKMSSKMNVRLGKLSYLSNFEPSRNDNRGMRYSGSDFDMNLYNKGFGGRSFKMTAEILEFEDVAYAGFDIE